MTAAEIQGRMAERGVRIDRTYTLLEQQVDPVTLATARALMVCQLEDEARLREAKPLALYDLPIFGWAWSEDAREVER